MHGDHLHSPHHSRATKASSLSTRYHIPFVNGELEEDLYVEQHKATLLKAKKIKFIISKRYYMASTKHLEHRIAKLIVILVQNGFHKSPSESCLYVKTPAPLNFLILGLFVDDLIYMGTSHRQ